MSEVLTTLPYPSIGIIIRKQRRGDFIEDAPPHKQSQGVDRHIEFCREREYCRTTCFVRGG